MTDFDTLFDATNNESGIIIFPNNDVIIGNWTYSGHGVPRLSPFGDTLVSTGTIDKAENKGLVNIESFHGFLLLRLLEAATASHGNTLGRHSYSR